MTLPSLQHGLNVVRPLLESVLLGIMIRREIYRRFPFFFSYVTQAILQTLILTSMRYAPFVTGAQYFYAYSAGAALSAVLSFAVVYEVFKRTFIDYPALSSLGKNLLRWGSVFLLLVAIVLARGAPGAGEGLLMSKFDVMLRSVSFLQCGLLILLLLFSRASGVFLRSHAFGIAMGFGIIASLNLADYAIRSQIEPTSRTPALSLLTIVTGLAYSCAILLWMVYLWAAEPALSLPNTLPTHILETWNQELQRLLKQ